MQKAQTIQAKSSELNTNLRISLVLCLLGPSITPLLANYLPQLHGFIYDTLYVGYIKFIDLILSTTAKSVSSMWSFKGGFLLNPVSILTLILDSVIYVAVLLIKYLTSTFAALTFNICSMQSNLWVKFIISVAQNALVGFAFIFAINKKFKKITNWELYICILLVYFPISIFSLPMIILYEVLTRIRSYRKLNELKKHNAHQEPCILDKTIKNAAPQNKRRDIIEINHCKNRNHGSKSDDEWNFIFKDIGEVLNNIFNSNSKGSTSTNKNSEEPKSKINPYVNIDHKGKEKTAHLFYHSRDLKTEIDNLFSSFIGMGNVKKQVYEIVTSVEYQQKRRLNGLPVEPMNLHTIMLGNPGTGKTTVARVIGEIYKQLGVLTNGHVVEVQRADLVGEYIGQSELKIKAAIEKAMGGILFIDEAYSLSKKNSTNDFGHDVINVLVKEMEDKRDKFVVIAAGYRTEMLEFLSDNPGLKDRFPLKIDFSDYSTSELLQIFEKFCEKDSNILSNDTMPILRQEIVKLHRTRGRDFGNARVVRNLYEQVVRRLGVRVKEYNINDSIGVCLIRPEDIREEGINLNSKEYTDLLGELNNLTGMDDVKKKVKEFISYVSIQKERSEKGYDTKPVSLHLVMTGNPGTGKTTVARLLGKIFKSMGLLSSGHIVEVQRSDMVEGYIGQSENKAASVIDSAVGGVLFIDEAYSLFREDRSTDYGREVIEVLLKKMEDLRENLMVVVAGYPDKMEQFLSSNPGLKSRFATILYFNDYATGELVTIFKKNCIEEGYIITPEAEKALYRRIEAIPRSKNFGNAREIRNIFEESKKRQAVRLSALSQEKRNDLLNIIEKDDIYKQD